MTKKMNWQPFNPVRNADGDNCGTGAGGFKKGNTCGSKKGASRMVDHLVDYDAYTETRHGPGGLPPGLRKAPLNDILELAKEGVGRRPTFYNVSKKSVSLKWELRPGEDVVPYHMLRDKLLEHWYNVELKDLTKTKTKDMLYQRYYNSKPAPGSPSLFDYDTPAQALTAWNSWFDHLSAGWDQEANAGIMATEREQARLRIQRWFANPPTTPTRYVSIVIS